MSLAGLYWIKEGEQTFGSNVENDIVFPKEFDRKLGVITKNGDDVSISAHKTGLYSIDNQSLMQSKLTSDAEGKATMMNWKSYFWYLIKRGDQYAIRLKDTLSENRLNLRSVPSFQPSKRWIKQAKYIHADPDASIAITNVIGITYDSKFMGTLTFEHKGENFQLLATDGGNNTLFIVFADQTNGKETYGGGRFLYVLMPDEDQMAIVDFNKAENPICAFSDYATCPLPPRENYLPFIVNAGEKKVR